MERYWRQVETPRRELMVLMHRLGGMPTRDTEFMTIKTANTREGLRNIFLARGQPLIVVTGYSKTLATLDGPRLIARFLPPEVGRLLMAFITEIVPLSDFLAFANDDERPFSTDNFPDATRFRA